MAYGLAEVKISLKHSSYPTEKKKLSKRRTTSKSADKSESEVMEKEAKTVKEEMNQQTRDEEDGVLIDDIKVDETVIKDSSPPRESELNTRDGCVDGMTSPTVSETKSTGSMRATEPLITNYQDNSDDRLTNLAPVDDIARVASPVCDSSHGDSSSRRLLVAETGHANEINSKTASDGYVDKHSTRSSSDGYDKSNRSALEGLPDGDEVNKYDSVEDLYEKKDPSPEHGNIYQHSHIQVNFSTLITKRSYMYVRVRV